MLDFIVTLSNIPTVELIGRIIAGIFILFIITFVVRIYVRTFARLFNRKVISSLIDKPAMSAISTLNYIIFDEISSSLKYKSNLKDLNDEKHQEALDAFSNEEYTIALKIWKKLAKNKNIPAQFHLGNLYRKGLGVEQNYEKAAEWYRKAAEKEYGSAQNNLGTMYNNGLGVEQDYQEAVKWYRKAAEGKSETAKYAQYNLGISYSEGKGVPQSKIHAYMWLSISQANGYEEANDYLGDISKELSKEGLERSQEKAANWMEQNY